MKEGTTKNTPKQSELPLNEATAPKTQTTPAATEAPSAPATAKEPVAQTTPGLPKTTEAVNELAPATSAPVEKPQTGLARIDPKLMAIRHCFIDPKKAFIASGGSETEFAREVNFAKQALLKNDYLLDVANKSPESLIEAIQNVGLTKLTLNPELRLGYLIPRKGKVYFSSSYMGKREILMRSGCVRSIEVSLVYEGETFAIEKGTENYIKHIPDPWGDKTRANLKGGYWVAKLHNGEVMFDTVSKSRINEIMKRSEAVKSGKQSPWDTDYEEMAKKTVLNAAFKNLPKTGISEEVLKVLEAENKYDEDVFEDWKKQQESRDSFAEDKKLSFTDYEEVR